MLDVRADKQWLTAAEAAAEALPAFEYQERQIRNLISAHELRARKRNGRGGGREFHWTDLPAEARAEYLKRYGIRAAEPDSGIRDRHFEAEARAAIVAACSAFLAHRNLPVGKGVVDFVRAYLKRAASLRLEPWVYEAAPQITARALADWRSKFANGRTESLLDRRGRNPKPLTWIEDDEPLKRFIVATLVARPHLSAVAIRAAVEVELRRTDVPLRTLQAFLAALKKKNPSAIKSLTNPDRGKSHHRPGFGSLSMNITRINQLWEIDASPADVMCITPHGPRRWDITAIVDVKTRRARVVLSDQPRALSSQALLRRCILDFGLPERLKADNGKEYRNRGVERFCRDTGIDLDFSRPFSPEQKGHVERFFRTLQHGFVELLPGYVGHDITGRKAIENRRSFAHRFGEEADLAKENLLTPAELQARLDAWLINVYEQTVHSDLGMTPAAKAALHAHEVKRLVNGSVRALDVLLFDTKDGHGIRVVGKRGVRVDGIFYIAAELGEFMGQHVHVKVDPLDPSTAVIYSADASTFLCVARDADSLAGPERARVAVAAVRNFNAVNSRIRAGVRAMQKQHKPDGLADRMLRIAAVNGEQISPVAQSGRATDIPAIAAPAQNGTAGEGNVPEDAGSNPAGAATSLSSESARAMFDASRPTLIEHAKAQVAIEQSKSVPQPIPLTDEDHAGALVFLESTQPRRRIGGLAQCDGYTRPNFNDVEDHLVEIAFWRWAKTHLAAGSLLDRGDREEFERLRHSETFQLLLANTEARDRAIA